MNSISIVEESEAWNEVNKKINEIEDKSTHKFIPNSLGEVFLEVTQSDLEEIKQKRSDIKEEFNNITDNINNIQSKAETLIRNSKRRGQALPKDGADTLEEIEGYIEDANHLLKRRKPFLKNAEQQKLTELIEDLHTKQDYFSEKLLFDEEIEELEEWITDIESTLTEITDTNTLLTDRELEKVLQPLKDIEINIDALDDKVELELLSEPDKRRLENIEARIDELRETANSHNEDIIQEDIDDVIKQVDSKTENISTHIEEYQSGLSDLDIGLEEELDKIDAIKTELSECVSGDRNDIATPEHHNQIDDATEQLDELSEPLEAKLEFEEEVAELQEWITDIENTLDEITDTNSLLIDNELQEVLQPLKDIEANISALDDKIALDLLSEADKKRLEDIEVHIDELRQSAKSHNENVIQEDIDEVIKKVDALIDDTSTIVEEYQSGLSDLDINIEEELDKIDAIKTELSGCVSGDRNDIATPEQHGQVEDATEQLNELTEALEAKLEFDKTIIDLESEVDEIDAIIQKSEDSDENEIITEEIKSRLEVLEDEYETVIDKIDQSYLSEADCNDIGAVDSFIQDAHNRYEEHNRNVINEDAKKKIREITDEKNNKRVKIKEYRSENIEFDEDIQYIIDQLEDYRATIDNYFEGLYDQFISDAHRQELIELEEEMKNMIEIFTAKNLFNDIKLDIEEDLQAINQDLQIDKEDSNYLTTPRQKEILEERRKLESKLISAKEDLDSNLLSEQDENTLLQLENEIDSLARKVKNHNTNWLDAMRNKYEDELNSYFDNENASHTQNQLNAVFRNDAYNRVNAAAGTGKTTTLGRRVLFLLSQFSNTTAQDILSITFTKNGEQEMEEEFKEISEKADSHVNMTGVEVSTLNSYAKRVVEERYDNIRFVVGDAKQTDIELIWRDVISDPNRVETYNTFLTGWKNRNYDPDSRTEINSVYENHDDNSSKGILGEEIGYDSIPDETLAHIQITEVLNSYELDYVYKYTVDWDSKSKTDYTLDFRVDAEELDGPLFIEYAPTIETRQNRSHYENPAYEEIEQLENYFERLDGTIEKATISSLITISGENIIDDDPGSIYWSESKKNSFKNAIEKNLRNQLEDIPDLETAPENVLSDFDLKKQVYDKTILEKQVVANVEDFISQARVRGWSHEETKEQVSEYIAQNDPDESKVAFFRLATEAYKRFLEVYNNEDRTDFHGSLELATTLLQKGDVSQTHLYDHVLVDEMQDLNPVQFKLIKELSESNPDTRIFGVGDDWQSIFGFRGARPDLFINFGEKLGTEDYADTELESNHRCPDTVVSASNEVIRTNQIRTEKDPFGTPNGDKINVHHIACDTYSYILNNEMVDNTVELLRHTKYEPGETQVLLRQKGGDPIFFNMLRNKIESEVNVNGEGRVDIRTAHDAKGSEAKHVVIPKVIEQGGYPSRKESKWVAPVKKPPEVYVNNDAEYQIEEERRLFYVALTRSKERLDVLTVEGSESQFVGELPGEHTIHNRPLTPEEVAEIKSGGEVRKEVVGVVEDPPEGPYDYADKYAQIDWEDGGVVSANLWDATEEQKSMLIKNDGKPVLLSNCGIKYKDADTDDDDEDEESDETAQKLELQVDEETEILKE